MIIYIKLIIYYTYIVHIIYLFVKKLCISIIDINKVDKQLIHTINVKYRQRNGTFLNKLTKWHHDFDRALVHYKFHILRN